MHRRTFREENAQSKVLLLAMAACCHSEVLESNRFIQVSKEDVDNLIVQEELSLIHISEPTRQSP